MAMISEFDISFSYTLDIRAVEIAEDALGAA